MKFEVERDTFTDAVNWVARTIPNRPAIPVLAGLKLSVSDDGILSLSSRDSDITSHVDIAASVIETGSVLVNGKLLAEVCRNLPDKPITFTLDGTKVDLECGSARFILKTMPLDDYSEIPQIPVLVGTVSGEIWQQAVSQVTIAASNDDTLPLLVSVCLEIEGEQISLMATDRYQLAARDIVWEPTDSSIKKRILVRASRLLDIAKSLGTASTVEIYFDNAENTSIIAFKGAGKQNTVQLIEGEYPPVKTLFPTESEGYASVDRNSLFDAIRRSRVVVEKNAAVRLSFSSEEVVIEAGDGNAAQASEAINVELNGEEITLAFSPSLLQDGISVINSPKVRIAYTLPSKPALLIPEDKDGEIIPGFKILMMPIRTFG